jgi:uncharacterized membrane protein (UPF0127 family)
MRPLTTIGIACIAVLLAAGTPARVKDVDYDWARAVLPSGAEFNLEIADDPRSRWLGYRYREHVADDEGMLFIFAREQPLSFEMKDCLVSLDLIFLDAELRVVEIAHDRQPCVEGQPCSPISPMRIAQYVLELAGGTASREGLKPGDRVTVLSEPSIP